VLYWCTPEYVLVSPLGTVVGTVFRVILITAVVVLYISVSVSVIVKVLSLFKYASAYIISFGLIQKKRAQKYFANGI
jgi:hypothetical protein